MDGIKKKGVSFLFIFVLAVSLFGMPAAAYCSSEQLIQLIRETYREWEQKNPELATAFREEVDNLRILEAKEKITSDKASQKLEAAESKQAVSQQAADTKQGIVDDRKTTLSESAAQIINTKQSDDDPGGFSHHQEN